MKKFETEIIEKNETKKKEKREENNIVDKTLEVFEKQEHIALYKKFH